MEQENDNLKDKTYTTMLFIGLLVITVILSLVIAFGTISEIWKDILFIPLFFCANILAFIVILAFQEWSKQWKAKRKQKKYQESL